MTIDLFPLKLSGLLPLRLLWRSPESDLPGLMRRFESASVGIMDPVKMVNRALSNDIPVKVTEILPRLKDGGAFVKFTHPAEVTPKDIESRISKLLAEKPIKPFFSPFRGVQAGLVKGVPWLEDLQRFPKNRLRVEFVPKTLVRKPSSSPRRYCIACSDDMARYQRFLLSPGTRRNCPNTPMLTLVL